VRLQDLSLSWQIDQKLVDDGRDKENRRGKSINSLKSVVVGGASTLS
jgi:hypothetical protein